MSFHNDSSYGNPGIYRRSIEEIMYTPNRAAPAKKVFYDETLSTLKKVTRLKDKFENGTLNITENEPEQADNSDEGEDVCDGPVFANITTPLPKPRTILSIKRPQREVEETDEEDCFNPGVVETPILRTPSRQVSGSSFINSRLKTSQSDVKNMEYAIPESVDRYKTQSAGSYSSSASSTSSQETRCKTPTENATFNVNNQNYYSKFARAQVHEKFRMYFKWGSETLRAIAVAVSTMRLQALENLPLFEQDDRVRMMKKIYESCKKGANKEMDALCSALFDLLDDVSEPRLSIHEEYVVQKYNKKMQKK
ncbi:hypothetical protein CRE_19153 [Caenorhabditis remanei]|uniref:Uncharacterized protein n=1 Tax=Caenorhabditis remanei TaxID=31234 RepID=E3MJK9_CAERE|nr:hypothetical protein CRE_19153 [Caenorhabditis remanei]